VLEIHLSSVSTNQHKRFLIVVRFSEIENAILIDYETQEIILGIYKDYRYPCESFVSVYIRVYLKG
jgi:hypothetical protein